MLPTFNLRVLPSCHTNSDFLWKFSWRRYCCQRPASPLRSPAGSLRACNTCRQRRAFLSNSRLVAVLIRRSSAACLNRLVKVTMIAARELRANWRPIVLILLLLFLLPRLRLITSIIPTTTTTTTTTTPTATTANAITTYMQHSTFHLLHATSTTNLGRGGGGWGVL